MKSLFMGICVALLQSFFGPSLSASICMFPAPQLSLDKLWSRSAYVGFVEVLSVKRVDGASQLLLLEKESIKRAEGAPTKLKVYVQHGGCPYHYPYQAGQSVLVFLSFDSERNMYVPASFSESAIEMDQRSFALYSRLLRELPGILATNDAKKQAAMLLELYLKCAESPLIRGDAAYGIATVRHKKLATLTEAQINRIVGILLRENPPGTGSAALYSEVSDVPNRRIDRWLLRSLLKSDEPGWANLTHSAVESLPKRLNLSLPEATVKRIERYWDLSSAIDDDLEADDRSREEAKSRLNTLWGSLSFEIYLHCKSTLESSEATQ